MNTLLILGNDKFAGEALNQLVPLSEHVMVAVDCSTDIRRVLRLLLKKRLSCLLLIKMALCSYFRKGEKPASILSRIESNRDLQALFTWKKIDRIILFRAGLIISEEMLKNCIPIFNIHCARIPDYGGLGAIWNAIKDEAWEQQAILHNVTSTIDVGAILDSEPYRLDPRKSYCENENIAYLAGIRLLKRTLNRAISE